MKKQRQQPNVIVIVSDDQGPWAMGCAGNDEILTPNLDRLASRGIRFDNFFCASPVCSPARASILTGRIPSAHGVLDWLKFGHIDGHIKQGDDRAVEYLQGMTGYTDLLAKGGYVCGLSGKWHLGDSLRPQKSFSHWYTHQWGGDKYIGASMVRDGALFNEPGYVTDAITDDALEYIGKNKDRRFYLSVHYTAPHSPWDHDQHPRDLIDHYMGCPFHSCPDEPCHPWQTRVNPRGKGLKRVEILAGYYAAVTAMDRGIGRILDRLAAEGLEQDTLVFFTSDNGMNMGHHGVYGKGNGTFPMNMFDTSVKIPAIISHPGRIPEGIVDHGLHSHYDLMPTLLDYVGLPAPVGERLPGKSFAPLLRGEQTSANQEHVVVADEYGPVRMIRDREWKYVHRYPYGPHELYHLESDPDERRNLVGDPSRRNVVEMMRSRLTDFYLQYADPALDGSRQAVFGRGQMGPVGPRAMGRQEFTKGNIYTDEDGQPRPAGYCPPGVLPFDLRTPD